MRAAGTCSIPRSERAQAAAETAYARWPHRFDTRALLALVRTCLGRDARDSLALLCEAPGSCGYGDIHAAVAIGRELLVMNRPADARPFLDYALQRDPWNSDAAIALAKSLHLLDGINRRAALQWRNYSQRPNPPYTWTLEWLMEVLRPPGGAATRRDAFSRTPSSATRATPCSGRNSPSSTPSSATGKPPTECYTPLRGTGPLPL
jgi:hypothetical protein